MYISQFFILSPRGDKIVFKDYRSDLPRNTDEIFFRKFKFWDGANHQAPANGDCPPFFTEKGITFSFLIRSNMMFVACTRHNVSPAMLSEFIVRIAKLFKDFLGILSEEAIRKNFIMVYEILDEVADFGIIQEPSSEALMAHIFNPVVRVEAQKEITMISSAISTLKNTATGMSVKKAAHSQISVMEGVSNRKNEIYMDVLENLNAVFNMAGQTINAEINGLIVMKSFLQGCPDIHLGLNPDLVVGRDDSRFRYASVSLDSVNFHDAVDYTKFESDRSITLRPPDGEFTIMNYRCTSLDLNMPFKVYPVVDGVGPYKVEVTLKVRADFPSSTAGCNVQVKLPLPKSTTSAGVELGQNAMGQGHEYNNAEKILTWKIKKFHGGTEHMAKVRLSTSAPFTSSSRKEVGPISMAFEIPMHTVSGLSVKYMKIEERSKTYNPHRWVRNISKANSYVTRLT